MVKILHIRCADIETEMHTIQIFKQLKNHEIPKDVIIVYSYIKKKGWFKKLNEIEFEIFDLE